MRLAKGLKGKAYYHEYIPASAAAADPYWVLFTKSFGARFDDELAVLRGTALELIPDFREPSSQEGVHSQSATPL